MESDEWRQEQYKKLRQEAQERKNKERRDVMELAAKERTKRKKDTDDYSPHSKKRRDSSYDRRPITPPMFEGEPLEQTEVFLISSNVEKSLALLFG
jgi:hypothetical protein